jgi:hypothetical protein
VTGTSYRCLRGTTPYDDLFRAEVLPPFARRSSSGPSFRSRFELPPDPDFLRPRLGAPGEFAIRAARSFDMPFALEASYCFSFFTLGRLWASRRSCRPVRLDPSLSATEGTKPWLRAECEGYGGDMPSKTKESKKGTVVTALGESALTGLPGRVGGAVAKPVSQRTRWSEQQIRTAIGLALFVWALYRVLRPAVRAIRNR